MNLLNEIFTHKRREVEKQKAEIPLEVYLEGISSASPTISITEKLLERKKPALIAEVKHKSPSKGILIENFNPIDLARIYFENGAAAISVLTDEFFFGGDLSYLLNIRNSFRNIPLLRKDFIFDPYQIYQSRFLGADALLLIVSKLDFYELRDLYKITLSLGMTPLLEIHSKEDLEKALFLNPILIGVNNRDLTTFETNLQTTIQLRQLIPDSVVVVSESGINSIEDIIFLNSCNIDAVLIGEALVTSKHIEASTSLFSGKVNS
jgi:indole-3-glycerol phosphate synthase